MTMASSRPRLCASFRVNRLRVPVSAVDPTVGTCASQLKCVGNQAEVSEAEEDDVKVDASSVGYRSLSRPRWRSISVQLQQIPRRGGSIGDRSLEGQPGAPSGTPASWSGHVERRDPLSAPGSLRSGAAAQERRAHRHVNEMSGRAAAPLIARRRWPGR